MEDKGLLHGVETREHCGALKIEVTGLLKEQNLTLSLAESCTGGLIAQKITDMPGSSDYFMYGVVSYSNDAKNRILGVNHNTLEKYGAVSRETALEMAEGVRRIGDTDLAVAVTGIAGPGGGSDDKPVGLVYISLATRDGVECQKFIFEGDREGIREATARAALEMIRIYILKNKP